MQETTYFELTRDFEESCTQRNGNVGAMYPTDVPLVADYPYYVVDAPWVDPHEREAARVFGDWLDTALREQCDLVKSQGYHKDQSCYPEGSQPLSWEPKQWLPEPDALREVQLAWDEIRRAANVLIVVERTDAQMSAYQLDAELQVLANDDEDDFAACPGRQDRVALFQFGDDAPVPQNLDAYVADDFRHKVGQLDYGHPRGGLDVALTDAVNLLEKQSDGPINTIVVLAWGDGDLDRLETLTDHLRGDGAHPQIVAALFGEETELDPIKGVVRASFGRYEFFDPEVIDVGAVADFVCGFF
jgi:hypothetical protein